MNDQQLIAQMNECLDNETPVGWTVLRDALWAYRRENEELRRQLNPSLMTGLKPLKGRQSAVYDFLVSFIGKHGYGPTSTEIAAGVGLASRSTAFGHLERLEKAGYIDRNGGKPRAITIIGARQ